MILFHNTCVELIFTRGFTIHFLAVFEFCHHVRAFKYLFKIHGYLTITCEGVIQNNNIHMYVNSFRWVEIWNFVYYSFIDVSWLESRPAIEKKTVCSTKLLVFNAFDLLWTTLLSLSLFNFVNKQHVLVHCRQCREKISLFRKKRNDIIKCSVFYKDTNILIHICTYIHPNNHARFIWVVFQIFDIKFRKWKIKSSIISNWCKTTHWLSSYQWFHYEFSVI